MKALDRKLLRDLLQMKGQALAIGLVMASGVAMFVMTHNTMQSLQQTQTTYYERYRFADVFTQLKRAPSTLAARIAEIPGAARVQTRVVVDVTLDVPGLDEPATGRLISIPERQTPGLNDVYLRSGRYIEPGRNGEVLVNESFAQAHGFQPGNQVVAVINGRKQRLTIVGIALSPEYIYLIRPGGIFPDDKRFGVFWMGYTELASAYNMYGAFNAVSLTLMPGASEPEVLERLDQLTEPYGGLGASGREDQLSHRFLSDEIKGLQVQGVIVPGIFLSVAAFLLNMVMSRLIGTQREQIAALKAFGYSNFEVGLHYVKFVLVLVVLGALLGTAAGIWLGRLMTEMYTRFYHFPMFVFHLDIGVVVLAVLISAAAALLGTLGAVRRAVLLPPAEALRPEPPARYRPTVVERLGLQRLFPQTARMILRELERKPVKALFSCVAIAMGVAILVTGSFMLDALEYMMEYQFDIAQRQDMTVGFVEPTTARGFQELRHLPGVLHGEPFRSLPVRLRAGHRTYRVGIMGLDPQGQLYRIIDARHRAVPAPAEGILMSEQLAERLQVQVGQMLTLEVLEGERPVRELAVAGLVRDYTGVSAYMDRRALNRLMREGSTVSGAFLSVDEQAMDALYRTLKATPRVASVTVKATALRSFWETIAENLLFMRVFNITFASIIACGVVYNTARISLSERSRELATLRVIGFSRAEISAILLGELAVLTFVAIPLGLALGYGLAAWAAWALATELYRIPLVVNPSTFAFASTVVLIATLVSGLSVRRRLDHLDLVAVLKTKE
ncbi:MAG: ABC transporter permease [Gemmataceae bacterium]|nr:ABC transporter permease [Gemmataceae bacterium]